MGALKDLRYTIKSIKTHDPAIRSTVEVFLYQGLWAILFHRLAHKLYRKKHFFLARLVSQKSRFLTGIEIHPGARIGKGVFFDHGSGVVVGETAVIGNGVVIYQGVTLGGTGKDTGKRHPTIGNNVMIGAHAIILGNIKIGDNAKIGANSIVVKDVEKDHTVVGESGRDTTQKALRKEIECLKKRIVQLESR